MTHLQAPFVLLPTDHFRHWYPALENLRLRRAKPWSVTMYTRPRVWHWSIHPTGWHARWWWLLVAIHLLSTHNQCCLHLLVFKHVVSFAVVTDVNAARFSPRIRLGQNLGYNVCGNGFRLGFFHYRCGFVDGVHHSSWGEGWHGNADHALTCWRLGTGPATLFQFHQLLASQVHFDSLLEINWKLRGRSENISCNKIFATRTELQSFHGQKSETFTCHKTLTHRIKFVSHKVGRFAVQHLNCYVAVTSIPLLQAHSK